MGFSGLKNILPAVLSASVYASLGLGLGANVLVAAPAVAKTFTLTGKAQEVTAYQGLALVKREVTVSIEEAGSHLLHITGLPLRLNPDSLHIQAYGSAQAVMQHFQLVTPLPFETPTLSAAEKKLKADLDALVAKMDALETREELNAVQKDFLKLFMDRLKASPKTQGSEDFSVKVWEDALQFTLENQRELLNAQQTVNQLKKELRDEIRRSQQALNYYRRHHPQSQRAEAQINVSQPGTVRLVISYLIPGVQWEPVYEARLVDEQLDLRYGGEILQQSGENWAAVKLKLSTATPQLNRVAPQPVGWSVNAYPPVPAGAARPKAVDRREMSNMMPAPVMEDQVAEFEALPEASAQIADHGIALDFALPGTQYLASSSSPRQVMLASRQIKADTTYKVIPRQSPLAFLEVNITNGTGLPLLPGKMRTYVGESFTGVQPLDLVRPGQETRLNFGVDRNIQVKWTELERKDGNAGVLTDKKVMNVVYQAEVTNYKKEPVDIRLLEPRPESQHPEVKVEWVKGEPDATEVTDEKLRIWNFKAQPWEKKKIRMHYRITYPQQLTLSF